MRVPLERIPLFVPASTVLPLAQPTLHTDDPQSWKLTAVVYGDGHRPATLFEDDGASPPTLKAVAISWNQAKKSGALARTSGLGGDAYQVVEWVQK